MSSALASLTADYTDSEEEQEDSPEKPVGTAPTAATAPPKGTPQPSGSNQGSAVSTPTKTNKTRLVSYVEEDDGLDESKTEGEDDPEDEDHGRETSSKTAGDSGADAATALTEDPNGSQVVPMDLDSDQDNSNPDSQTEAGRETRPPQTDDPPNDEDDEGPEATLNSSTVEVEAWSGGVQLPPEPAGLCDPRLQKSIQDLYKRKVERGFDMNAYIQQKKSFRNPSIYEKLIEFCGIDEHGTNFPKDLYDGHLFGKESYYEELRKVQDADIERREKAAKKSKSDAAASSASVRRGDDTNSSSSFSTTKRRSKWDQAAPSVAPSGALAKTISAFGPLKK